MKRLLVVALLLVGCASPQKWTDPDTGTVCYYTSVLWSPGGVDCLENR